jgi:hypothetical protein
MNMQNDTGSNEPHNQNGTGHWRGLAEIDEAIHENRLTEYRMKKAWADPWGKRLFLMIGAIFIGFAIFVVVQDVL